MAYNRFYGGQGTIGGIVNEIDTSECAEKVEAMVSTALLHQEDVWNMLMNMFPDNTVYDPNSVSGMPPHVLAAIKDKLENAMDWCRLAQCRLKGIIPEKSTSTMRQPVGYCSSEMTQY